MDYILTVTEKGFDELNKSEDKVVDFKKIARVSLSKKYDIGDTSIRIANAKLHGLYKCIFKEKITYYLVIDVMDEETAFAWSLYPID